MNMYQTINRADLVQSILALGNEITFLVEGHIGSSKSSLIYDLAKALPEHTPVYIDMANIADSGDFQLPAVNHESKTSEFYPNTSLGLHTGKPMILMFDELGKSSSQSVINAVLPALNERRWGNRSFHPETLVFATTNLGRENVGDVLKPHVRNRITRVKMAKPTAKEYIAYMSNHNLHPILAAWIDRNPQCFASFEEYDNPDDNSYIYHPAVQRPAFVTHRSMTRANLIMHKRDMLTDDALVHALMGTVGAPAALDIVTFMRLADQLPTRQEIMNNPQFAQVPDNPSAMILLACQAYNWVDATTLPAWMTYMNRFAFAEAKALFAIQLTNNDNKYDWASRDQSFTDFARAHQHLF
jgi:hypothetical protein